MTKEAFRKLEGCKRKEAKRNTSSGRRQQHRDDLTLGILSTNVRGLVMQLENLGAHLQGLKERNDKGVSDVVFLQETHLKAEEHALAATNYAAMWGFRYTTAGGLSFWSEGNGRGAGVAILVNPYGGLKDTAAWREDLWSPHLVMVTAELKGRPVLLVNIYAPSVGADRIQFFQQLQQIAYPEDRELILGGDFNCVLNNEVDRRGGMTKKDCGANELVWLVNKLEIVDAGYFNSPQSRDRKALEAFANAHHTYRHTATSGAVSTSRLDRFYVRAAGKKWVRSVTTQDAPWHTDHKAVLLELHMPTGPVRQQRRPKLYPVPAFVQTATHSLIGTRLNLLQQRLVTLEPTNTVAVWDQFKKEIAAEIRNLKRTARRRLTQSFRQKIRRLKKRIEACGYSENSSGARRDTLLEQLRTVQDARRQRRRRILVQKSTWSSKASTRHFFNRICMKYGDKVMPPRRSLNEVNPRKNGGVPTSWRIVGSPYSTRLRVQERRHRNSSADTAQSGEEGLTVI